MVPAQVDPTTLGQNMYLLLGCWIVLAVLVVLAVVIWTVAKIVLWYQERKRIEQEQARRAVDQRTGRPYPPASRGFCDRCRRACEKVYYLPSGRRLCQACYDADQKG